MPAWQVEALAGQTKSKKEPALFADALVPALHKVRRAQGRLEQRIALLRHVEALRLYAAEHDGTLPAKLSDIAVPLPVDPFTGKPFRYEVEGATGSPPRHSAVGRGKGSPLQHPLRGDPPEMKKWMRVVRSES